MQRSDFHFDLPQHLIAQMPLAERTASRLLHLNRQTGAVQDQQFTDLSQHLQAGDLLVFNNTKVMPARLYGQKSTGGKVEMLLERITGEHTALAHVKASKSPKVGSFILLANEVKVEVLSRQDALFELQFHSHDSVLSVLEAQGHIPLPPYIEREDTDADKQRYQTVYAEQIGAVAAPTAGLHFDEALLAQLSEQGIQQVFVTLHVGAGTFQPVRVDDLSQHHMHSEWLSVEQSVVDAVQATHAAGNRVIAVGTTSVRALESAAVEGELKACQKDTQLFITPGYEFRVVDGLITNFHLPESTLMMLVSAFAGYEHVMQAYRHAVEQEYRFFSYGDAMLML